MHINNMARLAIVATAATTLVAGSSISPAAASTPTAAMTMSPTFTAVVHGGTVAVSVTVDTGGQAVNSVQFWLTFPDAKLDCSNIAPGSAWPSVAATSCTTSTAAFAAGSPGGASFSGKAAVATVYFKTNTVLGKAAITIDRTRTFVLAASDSTDILSTTNKATIKVK